LIFLEGMGVIRGICTVVIATFAIPSLVRAHALMGFATLSTTPLPPLSQATSSTRKQPRWGASVGSSRFQTSIAHTAKGVE